MPGSAASPDPAAGAGDLGGPGAPQRDWRDALLPLTGRAAGAGDARIPLALLIEVREKARREARSRWEHKGDTTRAASRASTGPLLVTARPGVPGKRGGWVSASFGWSGLQYRTNELGLDPAQVRWFVEFDVLSRAEPGRYSSGDGSRLVLDDYASPLLWRMLADAQARGIQLAYAGASGRVSLAGAAELEVVASGREDGALVLTPRIVVDGEQAAAGASAVGISDHGLALIDWSSASPLVTLAPTTRPVSPRELTLLSGGPIEVPPEDVPEFAHEVYPVLARSVSVHRTDGSNPTLRALPALEAPLLVVTVTFEPRQRLQLGFAWEYRTGDRVDRVGMQGSPTDPVRRDTEAEHAVVATVLDVLAAAGDPAEALAPRTLTGMDAAEWAANVLPVLEALAGGIIRIDTVGQRIDYRELTETPELTVTTVPTDQRDWFDLGVMVTVAGKQIPFMPLFRALASGRKKLLLVDHSYLSLNQPVFDRLRDLLVEAEALAEWDTGPRISRYQASLWTDFEDLADESRPAVEWRETVAGLLRTESSDVVAEVPFPRGLAADLRPYQRRGYEWLVFLWSHGLGGVLADDMGLGKTVQTLALIQYAREVGGTSGEGFDTRASRATQPTVGSAAAPFLVVAPASVVANWASEAARFTPGLRVASVTATRRKERTPLHEVIADADMVITTYAVFRLDHAEFAAQRWSGLVLDEAQFVKNHASQTHRLARELDAPFRLAVTGTPLENNLLELWAMFQIVAPGLFPSRPRFVEEYVKPIAAAASPVHGTDAAHGRARLERLRRRIRPLMLRRTKEIVAPELPPKQEQVLSIPLAPRHRALYDTWLQRERQKVLGLLDDLDRQRFIVYRSITLLRMLALDASLIDPVNEGVPSTKVDALLEQLGDVLAEGHRALVFSQFTSYLGKVAARLDAAGIRHEYLDGSTRRRADVIRAFREGDAPVFLISLKAGGFGLTLTEADYVFLLDPWWNPAAEAQAIDRTHRIGQTKQVMVYRMVASDTIEEKVMALARRKGELFDAVLDDDGTFSEALSADDIRSLLQ
ncbi:DEAD/DEAH box helicase [Rathayibacter sp. KR2-224]|uniref:DEAD/DEAH box helicase n=1 Tax=Rathayibacter sp. KR2-224 TaxID=3400913 RepID=UPI003C0BE6C9